MPDTKTRELETALALNPGDQQLRERLDRERERIRQPLPERTPDLWDGEGHTAKPMVGMACTDGAGSDSYPGTVVEVSKTGHQITVRRDTVKRTGGKLREGNWTGEYFADEDGGTTVYTRRRKKRCAKCGARSPLDVEHCDTQLMCRREPITKWLPVYRAKGVTGRGCGYPTLGLRRYYQDPHSRGRRNEN